MSELNKIRLTIGIVGGVFCLIVGLTQFLYSFLAFASVIFVDLLGLGLTVASSAIAAVPDKPYEVPYARVLANTIALTGMGFSLAMFVAGCRCFFLRRVPLPDFIVCTSICMFMAAMHFTNLLTYAGFIYAATSVIIAGMLVCDWGFVRAMDQNRQKQPLDAS